MKFKVGDRIKVVSISENCTYGRKGSQIGDIGIIKGFYDRKTISVEFDRCIRDGHTCQGTVMNWKGWNLDLDLYTIIKCNIPNNILSRTMYPNYKVSDCGQYLEII